MITEYSGPERQVFRHRARKTQSSSEKHSWELRRQILSYRKDRWRKQNFFVEGNQFQRFLQIWAKYSAFLWEPFLSSFVGRLCQIFGGNFEVNFLVKNLFSPFFAPSNCSGTLEEIFFAVNLKLQSRCSEKTIEVFCFEKNHFLFFFQTLRKEFRFLYENFKRYCQKVLLHY